MKFLLLSSLVGAVVATPPVDDASIATYTFEEFVADFDKTYSTQEEREMRRKVFEAAREDAAAHNADNAQSWKKGINQFSDVTQDEFRNSHGYVSPLAMGMLEEDGLGSGIEIPSDFKLGSLPASVDWRTKGVVTPVKNQGACGSCWAFASTEQVESYVAIGQQANASSDGLLVLSPQNLVSCSKNPKHCGGTGGCQGSIAELAFDFVKENGLASEKAYPYTSGSTGKTGTCTQGVKPSAHISGYVKLTTNNYTEVMYTLANVGPVAVNVDALPFQSYRSGVFTGCSATSADLDIDHVVQVVGYGTDSGKDYWILRNSWGESWGLKGYMHIERHSSEKWCGEDKKPLDGTGCEGGPATVEACGSCGLVYDVSYPTV